MLKQTKNIVTKFKKKYNNNKQFSEVIENIGDRIS